MIARLLLLLLALVAGCAAPPAPPTPTATPPASPTRTVAPAEPTRPPAPTPPARATPTAQSRPLGPPPITPFPAATTTVAGGFARLWASWPMEGRDPQRTSRSPERGPASARLRWSVAVPVGPSVPAVGADGTAYLGAADGRLVAYDPAGQTVWSVPIGRGPLSSPAVGPDGTVYVRTADGSLHARKPDGAPRWTTDIAAAPAETPHAPVVGPDRYLAMASYQSSLLMFVQPGGFFEYGFNVKARTLAGPALGVDRTLYGGAEDGTFWAISPEAIPRWTYQADGPVTSAPAVDPERGVYFLVGGGQPGLVALDLRGKLRWRAPACWAPAPRPLWPAVAADGTVVVGNCAFGPDGSPRWRLDLGPTWATPAALDVAGTAYLGTGDGRLLALAPDGTIRWSLDLGGGPAGPPVLAGPGAIILTAGSALDAVGE